MTTKDPRKNDLNHMISGALARSTVAIIMCPADTIKTRLQFQGAKNISHSVTRRYNGIGDAFFTILKNEGITGFARGLGPRLLYIIPSSAISFLCYERIAAVFRKPHDGYYGAILPFLGISTMRIVGTTVRTPLDVIKVRLQVQGDMKTIKYSNTIQAFKSLRKHEGFYGAFRFVPVSLLRDIPFAFFYFTSYEMFKSTQKKIFLSEEALSQNNENISKLKSWNHLLAGAGAGSLASALTIPVDVVKTRLQTQATLDQERYKGTLDAFKQILQEEGFRGLTRGLSARIVYIAPAIIFASYEQYKKMIHYLLS